MNATLAFWILALTSSSVPPVLFIVLPRYVNASVSSSGSPFLCVGFHSLCLASVDVESPVDTAALFFPALFMVV